ncbi:hypothetical protein PFLUV_G00161680 [Perca fluviatilis]|uniref:T-complex protein 1 subunit gamma n=1 Tax=Perca fluviatilis TaxID=8168 RepID=A0A6A5E1X7_PERFL|nr:hypothetical protein PFLUV_G00161680 [Perca fluviatilis]
MKINRYPGGIIQDSCVLKGVGCSGVLLLTRGVVPGGIIEDSCVLKGVVCSGVLLLTRGVVPGGIIEDSCVLKGVMVNKDVTHPRMKRMIKNPRIILLDCSLEYKKGESQTDIEISKEEDFARILQMEEEYVQQICEDIIRLKPDLVFTEKGISDLAQHYLVKANITAIRRVRKSDNNRISR